jgi:hypothetical protein
MAKTNKVIKPAKSSEPPSATHRRHPGLSPSRADGDDADAAPRESGPASETISLASEAEAEMIAEAELSIGSGDLGRPLLRALSQEVIAPAFHERGAARDLEPVRTEGTSHQLDDEMSDEDEIPPSAPSELDLTRDVISEGSLFDQPRNEGGTRRPAIRADDMSATLERNERAAQARGKRRAR